MNGCRYWPAGLILQNWIKRLTHTSVAWFPRHGDVRGSFLAGSILLGKPAAFKIWTISLGNFLGCGWRSKLPPGSGASEIVTVYQLLYYQNLERA